MGQYYLIECIAPEEWEDPALVEGIPPPAGESSWRTGRRFTNPPTEPILVGLHTEYGIQIKEFRNVDALLMTRRLYDALRDAGVHNLETYSTVIRHPTRDFECHDYVACNLVGLVTGGASKESPHGTPPDAIHNSGLHLIGSNNKIPEGLLMFRFAENTSAVGIHESVKEVLLSKGFSMLSFIPPQEWMG